MLPKTGTGSGEGVLNIGAAEGLSRSQPPLDALGLEHLLDFGNFGNRLPQLALDAHAQGHG